MSLILAKFVIGNNALMIQVLNYKKKYDYFFKIIYFLIILQGLCQISIKINHCTNEKICYSSCIQFFNTYFSMSACQNTKDTVAPIDRDKLISCTNVGTFTYDTVTYTGGYDFCTVL
jgi:hypothetical protein